MTRRPDGSILILLSGGGRIIIAPAREAEIEVRKEALDGDAWVTTELCVFPTSAVCDLAAAFAHFFDELRG